MRQCRRKPQAVPAGYSQWPCPPNEIVDQMLRQAQQYQQVATENQLRAIRRNTAHYLNIARTFEPGDLVFAFSESRGDQAPHRKLRIKWSGPYVFIRRINSQMAEIGTLPSARGQYRAKNFVIHCTKLMLHQRQGDQRPHADPLQFMRIGVVCAVFCVLRF